MAWSVMRQPNGLYAVWSTIVDGFLLVDGTERDVTDLYLDAARESALRDADTALARAVTNQRQQPKPGYDLRICLELAEANNPDDPSLPRIRELLER